MNKNDPKLTAFVLGEVNEAEQLEIQGFLEDNPELREEIESIRRTVAEIEETMRLEDASAGSAKASPSGALDRPDAAVKKRPYFSWIAGLSALALCVVFGGMLMPARQAAREASPKIKAINEAKQRAFDATTVEVLRKTNEGNPNKEAGRKAEQTGTSDSSLTPSRYGVAGAMGAIEGREQEAQEFVNGGNIFFGETSAEGKPAGGRETAAKQEYTGDALVTTSGQAPPAVGGAIYAIPEQTTLTGGAYLQPQAPAERRRMVRLGYEAQANTPASPASRGIQSISGTYDTGGMGMMAGRGSLPEESLSKERRGESVKVYPISDLVVDPYNKAKDEAYASFVENSFLKPKEAPFSTFSIDVDTASYTTMRRYVLEGRRPPKDSVRLEEYINYFKYDYPAPTDGKPFATHVEVVPCPWKREHLLARIGIKGREIPAGERPALNLVFLIDVSGSMSASNRLPLVKQGLTELVEMLQPKDRVAIVTYAGSAGVTLPSISGSEKRAILDSILALAAGGSTAGASGIKLAYDTARKYYAKEAQNRVILCTDGDFNVGTTDNKTLEDLIADEAKSGVFLTVLGFGMGNYKDDRLSMLSQRGNGNYGYIDTIEEARRMLVDQLAGTLVTIAKDVKIQVDFNPKRVAAYRLLGYENRKLRDEDFHDDTKDAGEIGAGHTVTALYEIVPTGIRVPQSVDTSRYADASETKEEPAGETAEPSDEKVRELMFVKLRYKLPDEDKSSLLEYPVTYTVRGDDPAMSEDMRFASAVTLFGMLLRESRYSGEGTWSDVRKLAEGATKDEKYRKEFLELLEKARSISSSGQNQPNTGKGLY